MKKLYFIVASIIACTSANGQITLTSANNTPVVGNSLTYFIDNAPTIPMPLPGTNQTWNFASAAGTSTALNYINLSSSVEPTTYPSANLVEVSGSGESYYNSASTSYTLEGLLTPGTLRIIYSDKREMLKFPITYPNVFNETFAGTVENISAGQTFDRSGTNVISADGYGALILPYATVNNVLRVTVARDYDDLLGQTPIANYIDTLISFYNATTKAVIASYSVTYVNGSLIASQSSYIAQADLVTGIDVIVNNANNVIIYPNPAKDQITIKSTSPIENVTIIDLTGKIIKEISPSFGLAQQVNTSDLSQGIYFVNYADENGTHTKKIIIK